MGGASYRIVGQGLAGTCLAWRLLERGATFKIYDREQGGGSRVAAGMINPVTGKNFLPSWRVKDFLPEATEFYDGLAERLGAKFWHPMPVVRLFSPKADWEKIRANFTNPEIAPWVVGEIASPHERWPHAVEVRGGGRLDVKGFLDASRAYFRERGWYHRGEIEFADSDHRTIWCEGAVGLMAGRPGPHRCAKGEILTIRADGWKETKMRVGDGAWLIPVGDGIYKLGATYNWVDMDSVPSDAGRVAVESMGRLLAPGPFSIIDHEAGVRPILRRSQPLIGPWRTGWMFNGLGSKGSLYAPGVAARLAEWLVTGRPPEREFDLNLFLATLKSHEKL